MPEKKPPKDLEERTYEFARDVRDFVKQLPTAETNIEDVPQLVRASGTVAANYVEANEGIETDLLVDYPEAGQRVFGN